MLNDTATVSASDGRKRSQSWHGDMGVPLFPGGVCLWEDQATPAKRSRDSGPGVDISPSFEKSLLSPPEPGFFAESS